MSLEREKENHPRRARNTLDQRTTGVVGTGGFGGVRGMFGRWLFTAAAGSMRCTSSTRSGNLSGVEHVLLFDAMLFVLSSQGSGLDVPDPFG